MDWAPIWYFLAFPPFQRLIFELRACIQQVMQTQMSYINLNPSNVKILTCNTNIHHKFLRQLQVGSCSQFVIAIRGNIMRGWLAWRLLFCQPINLSENMFFCHFQHMVPSSASQPATIHTYYKTRQSYEYHYVHNYNFWYTLWALWKKDNTWLAPNYNSQFDRS